MADDDHLFPNVERVPVDGNTIAQFTTEDEFTALAVSLMVEVASYTCVAACTLGEERSWDRDRAAVGGNVVRLFKLLDTMLDQTCQRRRQMSFIIARLASETAINLRFLIANFSPALIDSYIRYSLRHERRFWDMIQRNIAERGTEPSPIETRMLNSLARAARVAGIALETVDPRAGGNWGGMNIYQKAESVGLGDAYFAIFGGPSHSVHGNWEDIYEYHLNVSEDGRFTPNMDWGQPRPQLLLALGVIVVEAIHDWLGFIGGLEILAHVTERLTDLDGRIRFLDDAHERYLQQRRWPQI